MENVQIAQVDASEVYDLSRAEYDIAITTAKRFPRNIAQIKDNAIALATMDMETAKSCGYSLPRGGKTIKGKSVHLARILAREWGNLRAEVKVTGITANQIISEAVCFDLEKNYAIKVQVRKKIVDKHGNRFNDDMITVTGNALNAIAYRNAVLSVIPEAFTNAVYNETLKFITGDLSDEAKLIKKRKEVIDGFRDTYGVSEEELLKVLGKQTVRQINQEEIVILIGLAQAIKDGDTTVNETFNRDTKEKEEKKKEETKNLL